MANPRAVRFVKDLCAAFPRWPIRDDTKDIYQKKLSRWYLTDTQWDKALDAIIESQTEADKGLPELHEIYPFLRKAQFKETEISNLGWAYFRRYDRDFAIRIKCVDRVWLIADLVWVDYQGIEHHLQRNVGEPVIDHLPADIELESYHIAPDHPALPEPYQLPNEAEKRKFMEQINRNLSKGKLPELVLSGEQEL